MSPFYAKCANKSSPHTWLWMSHVLRVAGVAAAPSTLMLKPFRAMEIEDIRHPTSQMVWLIITLLPHCWKINFQVNNDKNRSRHIVRRSKQAHRVTLLVEGIGKWCVGPGL